MIGLSLQQRSDQQAALEELHGSQRYFLDYLMEEVLRRLSHAMVCRAYIFHAAFPRQDQAGQRPSSQAKHTPFSRTLWLWQHCGLMGKNFPFLTLLFTFT